jgi:hypothetical protein
VGVDQPGIALGHRGEVEAGAGEGGGAGVGHEDVGAVDQPARDLAALGEREVERHAPLVAVVELERRAHLARPQRREQAPEGIALRRLDLHHVGSMPRSRPPTLVSSTSTTPSSRSRSGRTMARRSLCIHVHAVR